MKDNTYIDTLLRFALMKTAEGGGGGGGGDEDYFEKYIKGETVEYSNDEITAIADNVFCKSTGLALSFPNATSVGKSSFEYLENSSLSLPALKTVGENSFYAMKTSTLNAPNIETVGKSGFAYSKLATLQTQKLKTAGDQAFAYMTSLTSFSAPLLESVGMSALVSCVELQSASLPLIGGTIPEQMFYGCKKLTSVVLGTVTALERQAFGLCELLPQSALPSLENVTSVGDSAFSGCKLLTSISLPAATFIDRYAFSDCIALTSVSAPLAEDVGAYCFKGCTSLTSVYLPAALSIGTNTFSNCTSLKQLELDSVTSLDPYAFSSGFETLIIKTPTMCTLSRNGNYFPSTMTAYVPDELVSQYQADSKWSRISSGRILPISQLPTA